MTTIFYPPLSSIMSLDAVPDELGFIKGGLSSLLDDIYFRDFQYSKSARGDVAHYRLSIVSLKPLEIGVPGTGLALVLNPGHGSASGSTSDFPITLGYEWGILAWLRDFDLSDFSFLPADFYQLALTVLGISERELIERALSIFITSPTPIDQFVDDVNAFYGTSMAHPTSGDPIGEVVTAIESEPGLEDAAIVIFAVYLLDNTDLSQTRDRLDAFFGSFFGGSVEDYFRDLLVPKVEATLEIAAALKFPRSILVPLDAIGGNELPEPAQSLLTFGAGDFFYSTERGIGYDQALSAKLTPSRIGKTGFEIEVTEAKLDISRKTNIPEATADGRPEDFVGVFIERATLKLPAFFNQDDGASSAAIIGRKLLMGTGGLSGTLALEAKNPSDPTPALVSARFGKGFELGLSAVSVAFHQNAIIGAEITGFMQIPGFEDAKGNDAEIIVDVSLGTDGDFKVTAREADGIAIRLAGVVEIVVRSLTVGRRDGRFFSAISGKLSFLDVGGFLKDNLPKDIEIQKLLIWDDGGIEIEGGALTLRDPKTLKIPPVELTITALHLGAHEQMHGGQLRRYKYVGFDGGLSVKPGGVDARGDGFKVYFTVDNNSAAGRPLHIFVRIQSIAIDLVIPGGAKPESASLLLKGYLSVKEPDPDLPDSDAGREYAGAVDFTLPKLKMRGSAAMRYNAKLPSFLIDVGLEISTPILLGSTGLGIYGFRGLVGRHFVASREHVGLAPDAKWYQYYKAKVAEEYREGIQVGKFAATEGFSLGAGVSLATAADAGKAFSSKIFFLLSLPEVFLLEGQGQFLKGRIGIDTTDDPPFYALIAISDRSVEGALGVNYRVSDEGQRPGAIATVNGLLELGFFFGDSAAWYVNLGRESPDAKRIQVQLLSLFNAYFYMMLSSSGIRAGAGASFALRKRFGPIKAELSAYLDVAARISFERKQFGGSIRLGGSVGLKIFRFGFEISVAASLAAEAAQPFLVSGSIKVCIRVLRKKRCVKFSFTWNFDRQLDTSEIPVLDGPRAAKALNILTQEAFPLYAIESAAIPEPTTWGNVDDYLIPLDSFIDIELAKAVDPLGSTHDSLARLGGVTHAAQHVELLPPQRVRSPQVKHEFLVERVDVMCWRVASPSKWVHYGVYEAMTPLAHLPLIDPDDLEGLKQGFWQLDHPARYNKLRLLAQTPFSYVTRGTDDLTVEELGVGAGTLFCPDEKTPPRCVLLADIAGPEEEVVPGERSLYAGGVLFRLRAGDGEVLQEDEGDFVRALALKVGQQLEIDFTEPVVSVALRLRSIASGVTFSYFQRVPEEEPDSSGLTVYTFEEIRSTTVAAHQLTEPVVYEDLEQPVDRVVIEAGPCTPGLPLVPGFVQLYENAQPLNFNGLIEDDDPARTVAFGRLGNGGLMTAFDPEGRVLWSRHYLSEAARQLSFTSGLVTDNGDLLISGSVVVGQGRSRHVVARMTAAGAPLWSYTYAAPSTRFHIGLARLTENAYVFTGWNNRHGSTSDDIELVRIDDQGQILLRRRIGGSADEQVSGILPVEGGVLVFGESSVNGWDGFLAFFDTALSLRWGTSLGTSRFDTVRSVVPLSSVEFLVYGVTSLAGSASASSSYVMRFHRRSNVREALVFDLFDDLSDRGSGRILRLGERFYLFAYSIADPRFSRLVALDLPADGAPSIDWVKRLELEGSHLLSAVLPASPTATELLAAGRSFGTGRPQAGLLAKTDLEFTSCATVHDQTPETTIAPFTASDWRPTTGDLEIEREALDLTVLDAGLQMVTVCRPSCTPDVPSTFLHELCYLPLSAAERNRTVISEADIQVDNDAMLRGLYNAIQPVWRPDTIFAIHVHTVDRVSVAGHGSTDNPRAHVFGFKTAGPVGHFHEYVPSQGGMAALRDDYQALLDEDREDQFALASLRPYIDYRRSYPNADGRLTLAKPLFYVAPRLLLFFLQDYVYSMYGDWEDYRGLERVSSALEAVVLDPLDSVAEPARFAVQPAWQRNGVPRDSGEVELLENLMAHGEPCTEVAPGAARRGVHAEIQLPDLKPSKAYTARFDAVYGKASSTPRRTAVHQYVFQTSRYADFAEQIHSYRLVGPDETGAATVAGEAVFEIDQPWSSAAVTAARSVLDGTADDSLVQGFADRFDRLLTGALGLGELHPPETMELNVVRDGARILGVLVRSPEPLNDPKLPAAERDRTVRLEVGGDARFQAVFSKDLAQVFLTDDAASFDLPAGIYRFAFEFLLFNGEAYEPVDRVDDVEIEIV